MTSTRLKVPLLSESFPPLPSTVTLKPPLLPVSVTVREMPLAMSTTLVTFFPPVASVTGPRVSS